MLRLLLIVAGVLLVLTVGLYAYMYFGRSTGLRPPEELARDALDGGSTAVREQAALDLARSGERGREHSLRVLRDSKSPDVKAAVIQGLAARRDFESMPRILELMEDPAEKVRTSAGAAVAEILGADFFFRGDDPPEKRAKAIQAIRREYEKMKKKPPPKYRKG